VPIGMTLITLPVHDVSITAGNRIISIWFWHVTVFEERYAWIGIRITVSVDFVTGIRTISVLK